MRTIPSGTKSLLAVQPAPAHGRVGFVQVPDGRSLGHGHVVQDTDGADDDAGEKQTEAWKGAGPLPCRVVVSRTAVDAPRGDGFDHAAQTVRLWAEVPMRVSDCLDVCEQAPVTVVSRTSFVTGTAQDVTGTPRAAIRALSGTRDRRSTSSTVWCRGWVVASASARTDRSRASSS